MPYGRLHGGSVSKAEASQDAGIQDIGQFLPVVAPALVAQLLQGKAAFNKPAQRCFLYGQAQGHLKAAKPVIWHMVQHRHEQGGIGQDDGASFVVCGASKVFA